MKMLLSGISHVFDCSDPEKINCVIIENQNLLYDILCDIAGQLDGIEGNSVLSEENNVIPMNKNLEMLSQFVPFEINKKNLLSKLQGKILQLALEDVNYATTMELMSAIEKYCIELSMNMTGNVEFTKITVENLIKNVGAEFDDNYSNLSEKLIDYFELVREYDKDKVFVLVNLRSVVKDEELDLLLETSLARKYQLLLIDSSEHKLLSNEKRHIIDENLCEIW